MRVGHCPFHTLPAHSTPLQATGGVEVKGKGLMHTYLWREETAEEAAELGESIRLQQTSLAAGNSSQILPHFDRASAGSHRLHTMRVRDSSQRLIPSSTTAADADSADGALAVARGDDSFRLASSTASLTKLSRLHTSSTLAKLPEFPPDILIRSGSSGILSDDGRCRPLVGSSGSCSAIAAVGPPPPSFVSLALA